MLVVGDTGKAILFRVNSKNENWSVIKRFEAHSIMIYDSTYVGSVKASTDNDLFITATINGNIKLWTSDGDYISDINQPVWPINLLNKSPSYFEQSPAKRMANYSISEDESESSDVGSEINQFDESPIMKKIKFSGL